MNNKVTILTSAIGLGTYNPSLVLYRQMCSQGIDCSVYVYETFLDDTEKQKIRKNKNACHANHKVASMFMNVAESSKPQLGKFVAADNIIKEWAKERRNVFVVFSGFWYTTLAYYQESILNQRIKIYKVHMDAAMAPSWMNWKAIDETEQEIWMFGHNSGSHMINVERGENFPYLQRKSEVVIHGGGWGIGVNKDMSNELSEFGYKAKIVHLYKRDILGTDTADQFYMGEWNAWCNEDGIYDFPPLYDRNDNIVVNDMYATFGMCRQALAIISKPGGGTLLDSLSACTPLIFTQPIARHEKANAQYWEKMGFGISYEKWKDYNFSSDILKKMHTNIQNWKDKKTELANLIIANKINQREVYE